MSKVDILKHELVPEHIILTEKEAKEVLERYNIAKGQLPKVLADDPVIKKIEANVGDIVRIIRISPTAGTTDVYRVVTAEGF